MKFEIKPVEISVRGNQLLLRPMSRREANEFREQMMAADGDLSEQERIGVALIERHVTFEDGSPLVADDLPNEDLVTLMQRLAGAPTGGVSDFTRTA